MKTCLTHNSWRSVHILKGKKNNTIKNVDTERLIIFGLKFRLKCHILNEMVSLGGKKVKPLARVYVSCQLSQERFHLHVCQA